MFFLQGTNVNEAKAMMASSGMKLISRDNLDEAARWVTLSYLIKKTLQPIHKWYYWQSDIPQNRSFIFFQACSQDVEYHWSCQGGGTQCLLWHLINTSKVKVLKLLMCFIFTSQKWKSWYFLGAAFPHLKSANQWIKTCSLNTQNLDVTLISITVVICRSLMNFVIICGDTRVILGRMSDEKSNPYSGNLTIFP